MRFLDSSPLRNFLTPSSTMSHSMGGGSPPIKSSDIETKLISADNGKETPTSLILTTSNSKRDCWTQEKQA
ncbi:hypothetical protein YC2023_093978 [Brassica napus]